MPGPCLGFRPHGQAPLAEPRVLMASLSFPLLISLDGAGNIIKIKSPGCLELFLFLVPHQALRCAGAGFPLGQHG